MPWSPARHVRRIKYARPGLFVHLAVTDTGSGITAQDLPHIFEPFYTTKEVQKGTGLGLATVYGIVKQHHGWVNVQSAVGEGATFDVYLPAVAVPAGLEIVPEQEVAAIGGGETLLVVEDEESVARLARLLLERHGYTVLEAADGPAALAVWAQHRGRIDLVLTDMVMPGGMSGLQLANQLLQQHPRVRVIVSSGYSPELFETDPTRIDRMSYLQKPYSTHQLLTMVREGLDAR